MELNFPVESGKCEEYSAATIAVEWKDPEIISNLLNESSNFLTKIGVLKNFLEEKCNLTITQNNWIS